jgi:hypothetical protein
VSRKFVYQQANKARLALDDALISAAADDEVLFEIPVTKRWLRQVIVALALMCRGSYLGIIEFMRDVLGASISMGTVHNVRRSAAEQAGVINGAQDLSRIRTAGLHDELFHGGMPVLAGVCAQSTYCYLLAAEHHRDADTWGVHLLDAAQQGLKLDYTIADAGQGLRAGHARRIRPVRVALRNQRDDLLAFAGVLDKKLAGIAQTLEISRPLVREACVLHRLPTTSTAYWRGWNRLRAEMGGKFHAVFEAVRQAMTRTPRSSSLVENLNSRLRNYFTLRRHLGSLCLDLLRFFLNHRRYMRSQLAERIGKSPRELMTGESHPYWLTLLGLGPLQNQRPEPGRLTASPHNSPLIEIRPSTAGHFRASVCYPKMAENEPRPPLDVVGPH